MIVNAIYRNGHQLFSHWSYNFFLFPYFIPWKESHKSSPHSSRRERLNYTSWRGESLCLLLGILLWGRFVTSLPFIYSYQSRLCIYFILWVIIQILLFCCSSCSIGCSLRLASVTLWYALLFCYFWALPCFWGINI